MEQKGVAMKRPSNTITADRCFLFGGLSAESVRVAVATLPPPTEFKKGTFVRARANGESALGILLSGSAVVRRIGSDGKEQLCNRLFADDAFGAAALFSDSETVSRVLAAEDCTVQFVPQSQLLALMTEHPAVAENLVRFLTERIRFLNRSLNSLRGGTAAQRLLSFLKTQADEAGTLTLPSMSSLAETLSLGRTSLYRAFEELEQSGILVRNGKTVTLIAHT